MKMFYKKVFHENATEINTKCNKFYYKTRQLFITKCDSCNEKATILLQMRQLIQNVKFTTRYHSTWRSAALLKMNNLIIVFCFLFGFFFDH